MVVSSLKKDNLSSQSPSTSSLHLGSHFFFFFHSLTPPRFGALNLPEVNQFTGNYFRMVRIVLKRTFLTLRYPKGVTGRLPLCPIMALDNTKHDKTQQNTIQYNTIQQNTTLFKEGDVITFLKVYSFLTY